MKIIHDVYFIIKKDKSFIIREYLTNGDNHVLIGHTGDNTRTIYKGNHMGFFWNVHNYCVKNYKIQKDEVRTDGVRILKFRSMV